MELTHIALGQLAVSAANMRKARKASDISDILPSIRARGVLVPLLVRPHGEAGRFEIVAGRRRYHAALAVQDEGGEVEPLPCAVMAAGDDAAALEASLIENLARLDPDEMTQCVTFTRLVKQGRSVGDIAGTFGLTELQVRRILALGNLHPAIRDLYRREGIDAASIRHLTLASRLKQEEWLALWRDPSAHAPTGHQLRQWLFGGASISAKVALFDLARYPAPIIADLFGEDSYFSDAEAFWTLQHTAVESLRQTLLEAGWSDAVVLEVGEHFHRWEHEKVDRAKGGKVYIAISRQGEVEVHEGWLTRREARRLEQQDEGPAAKPPRPELTAPLQAYVDLHRHAAVRAELLSHPKVALRLMVAHAVAGSWLWSIKPEPQRAPSDAIARSVESCASEARFEAKRREVLALLAVDAEQSKVVRDHGLTFGLVTLFEHLLTLSDEDVMRVLAIVMGETLAAGCPVVERVGIELGIEMARHWQGDPVLLGLVRDRAVLTAMLREMGEPGIAEANAKEKSRTIRAVIADYINGNNGRPKVEGWVPRWLCFPAGSYGEPVEAQTRTP